MAERQQRRVIDINDIITSLYISDHGDEDTYWEAHDIHDKCKECSKLKN